MINKQPAYILVTTLLVLGCLSAALVLQNGIFKEQLVSQQELNRNTEIERIQILASIAYGQQARSSFDLEGHHIEVKDHQLLIYFKGHNSYQRSLLVAHQE